VPPPPPPLGRPRKKAAHSFEPALDDTDLVTARTALAQGRWTEVRALLAATGDDWDRRGHRITVLAQEPTAAAWTRDWQLAEPESTDAPVLLACAGAARALAGKGRPDRAREALRAAAALVPDDPTPWLALLILERRIGREEDVVQIFDEVRHRHPGHHHAHHLMVARLAERRAAAGQDPLHEVYDFASWAAEQAPPASPLAVLPVVAHAERYRVLAAAGIEPADPVASGHWTGRRARLVMKTAFDWWLERGEGPDRGGPGHPRGAVDLNFLAHAKYCEGRPAEAAVLFHRIGPHLTPEPWSYPDRDPYAAFHAARGAALGTV
jgi:tetratricopeptide (TPR) repeat protein